MQSSVSDLQHSIDNKNNNAKMSKKPVNIRKIKNDVSAVIKKRKKRQK